MTKKTNPRAWPEALLVASALVLAGCDDCGRTGALDSRSGTLTFGVGQTRSTLSASIHIEAGAPETEFRISECNANEFTVEIQDASGSAAWPNMGDGCARSVFIDEEVDADVNIRILVTRFDASSADTRPVELTVYGATCGSEGGRGTIDAFAN